MRPATVDWLLLQSIIAGRRANCVFLANFELIRWRDKEAEAEADEADDERAK